MRLFWMAILLLVFSGCIPQQPPAGPAPLSHLVVRGEARIKVKPDQVKMSLEAVTSAQTAEEALAANSAAIQKLQELLGQEGLTAADYRTGQFSIQPQWSRPPRPAPASWNPEIVGYRVSNSLWVATSRIDLAGRLLALAQQAGVNRTGNLSFSLADPEEANRQAIAMATENAQRRAEVLAQAAGVKLGPLLEARVEEGAPGMPPGMMMAEMTSVRAAVNNVPITAGEVEVTAAVVLDYAVKNQVRELR